MQTIANQSYALPATAATHSLPVFPPLEQITRPTVPTNQAAYYLNRRPQTLRSWASTEPIGAIKPIRCMGRLAWPVADIRKLLNGEAI